MVVVRVNALRFLFLLLSKCSFYSSVSSSWIPLGRTQQQEAESYYYYPPTTIHDRNYLLNNLFTSLFYPQEEPIVRRRRVYLPRVDISREYDLGPSLIAYDPSYLLPSPPLPPSIDPSDGYKTQFVCDYDYDPGTDSGSDYLDSCFYFVYTPKKTSINKLEGMSYFYSRGSSGFLYPPREYDHM